LTDVIARSHSKNTGTINQQKIQHFQDMLVNVSSTLLYIHKLQIKISIDKENYEYLDLSIKGNAKVLLEKIGQTHALSQCRISILYQWHYYDIHNLY
jgi:hypothetical protein